jgi:hypothetical protein
MLRSGAFSWPFLVAFVIAAPLILLDWARPPVALEVNPAGLWINTEFLPWNDVQAIAIRPAPGGSDVLVRLRPDSGLLTGPLAAYLQPDPDHGWHVRRRVRHTRLDINALTAATLPYVSIDVLPA